MVAQQIISVRALLNELIAFCVRASIELITVLIRRLHNKLLPCVCVSNELIV